MNDLISRQAAIEALAEEFYYIDEDYETAVEAIEGLPSTQPELITVNIDHELTQEEYEKLRKDMANAPVMLLQSAQPESDEYARGYNDAKREIALSGEYERAYQRGKEDAQQWIPCSERLPRKGMRAVLLYNNEKISGGVYLGDRVWNVDYNDTDLSVYIVAWMESPEPWKGEES